MKQKSLGYSDERGGIPIRPQPRALREDDGFDWDVTRPLAEQWPWGPADPAHMARGDAMLDEAIAKADRVIEHATSVAADGLLTRDEVAAIIALSSDSYEPKP